MRVFVPLQPDQQACKSDAAALHKVAQHVQQRSTQVHVLVVVIVPVLAGMVVVVAVVVALVAVCMARRVAPVACLALQ